MFSKHVDQFKGMAQCCNIIPAVSNQLVESLHIHISKTNMNNTRRRFDEHDSIREVTIFGDNYQVIFYSIIPNFFICPFIVNVFYMNEVFIISGRKIIRQVGIYNIFHATLRVYLRFIKSMANAKQASISSDSNDGY